MIDRRLLQSVRCIGVTSCAICTRIVVKPSWTSSLRRGVCPTATMAYRWIVHSIATYPLSCYLLPPCLIVVCAAALHTAVLLSARHRTSYSISFYERIALFCLGSFERSALSTRTLTEHPVKYLADRAWAVVGLVPAKLNGFPAICGYYRERQIAGCGQSSDVCGKGCTPKIAAPGCFRAPKYIIKAIRTTVPARRPPPLLMLLLLQLLLLMLLLDVRRRQPLDKKIIHTQKLAKAMPSIVLR